MSTIIDGGILGVLVFIATKLQIINDMSHKLNERLIEIHGLLERNVRK